MNAALWLAAAAIASLHCTEGAFYPGRDVQIFTMTGCNTPSGMGDAQCPHNPTGGSATAQSCAGGADTWTSAADVVDCTKQRVAAAVLLQTSGKNTRISDDILVYSKRNTGPTTLTSPPETATDVFVPAETVTVSAGPVVAETTLSAVLPNSKIGPTVGRNGVISWDYEVATRAWNPNKAQESSCVPYEYPCSHEAANTNSAGTFTEAGVLQSCSSEESQNQCNHFFPDVSSWYPNDECAAALSPFEASGAGAGWEQYCWHSTCGSLALNDNLDVLWMKENEELSGIAMKCAGTHAGSKHLTLSGHEEKSLRHDLSGYDFKRDTDHQWSKCGLSQGPAVTTPNVQMSSKECKDLRESSVKWAVMWEYANKNMWGNQYTGTVMQTRTKKCGRLYETTQQDFSYKTNLTLTIKNSQGDFIQTHHALKSTEVPTPWIPTDACSGPGGQNDPGCFHFKVQSWDVSEGAMDMGAVRSGTFVLEYPWTGDVNGPDVQEWKVPTNWAYYRGVETDKKWWSADGRQAVDATPPQPMSIHGGKTGGTVELEAMSVCNARPTNTSIPPLSSTSTRWLYPGFEASEGAEEGSVEASGFAPTTGDPILFPSNALWADGKVRPSGESQFSYTNMRFQNWLYEQGRAESSRGTATIGPYLPWFDSSAEGIPISSRAGQNPGPRPFYWLTKDTPDGDNMPKLNVQAFSTTANILVYVMIPKDNIAVSEAPDCGSPAEVSVLSCATVMGSAAGGVTALVKNTNAGWCPMYYETECGGESIPAISASGTLQLDGGANQTLFLPVVALSAADFPCSVRVFMGSEGTNTSVSTSQCTVKLHTPNTSNIYAPELPECVNCKQVGRGNTAPKHRMPTGTLVAIVTSSFVGLLSIFGVVWKIKS